MSEDDSNCCLCFVLIALGYLFWAGVASWVKILVELARTLGT